MRYALAAIAVLLCSPAYAQARVSTDEEIRSVLGFYRGQYAPKPKPPQAAQPAKSEVVYLASLFREPNDGSGYLYAYDALMTYWGAGKPTWVRKFNSTGDGVQTEVHDFYLNNRKYRIAKVCKPHSGDEACLNVVFNDPNTGPVAWGYYVVNGSFSWIGVPPIEVAERVERIFTDAGSD